jgi:hypothetical protein
MMQKFKKLRLLLSIITLVGILAGLMPVGAAMAAGTQPTGSGSQNDPYLIQSVDDFRWMMEQSVSGNTFGGEYFLQTTNLDFSKQTELVPVGPDASGFEGIYDGGGHVIKNYSLNSSTFASSTNIYYGLFGRLVNATVQNLGLENISYQNIFGQSSPIPSSIDLGGLAGIAENTVIQNVFVTGTIDTNINSNLGYSKIGGLIAEVDVQSTVSYAYTNINFDSTAANGSESGGLFHTVDGRVRDVAALGVSNPQNYNYQLFYSATNSVENAYGVYENPANLYNYLGGYGMSIYWIQKNDFKDQNNLDLNTNLFNPWDFTTLWTIQPNANDGFPTFQNAISHDATLSSVLNNLNLTWMPSFSSQNTNYSLNVPNFRSSIRLAPTSNWGATITVNGTVVPSGQASQPIALSVGSNTITVHVTAQDGISTKTYFFTVTRAANHDSTLGNIVVSNTVNWSQAFSPIQTAYTVFTMPSRTSATITPTVNDPNATVTVNNIPVQSGTASAAIPLQPGSNYVYVKVTAQDLTSTTYYLNLYRDVSTDAKLSNLTTSDGSLSPAFNANTTSYTVSVANSVQSIGLHADLNEPHGTIKLDGQSVVDRFMTTKPLNVGDNTFTFVTTAQDGVTTKTYTVVVTRDAAPALSSDATLSSLAPSVGNLSPAFAPGTTSYTMQVGNEVDKLHFTPVTTDANATLSANATADIALNTGANTVTIGVTAQDGTTESYTVVITRAAPVLSSDYTFASFTVGTDTSCVQQFAAHHFACTVHVPKATTSIVVTPVTNHVAATVAYLGAVIPRGASTSALPLDMGLNMFSFMVTAEDGTAKNHILHIIRDLSSDATLSSLAPSVGNLSPAFAPGTTSYTMQVDHEDADIRFTPVVSDADAIVTVNGTAVASGQASSAIPLGVGTNTVHIVVTPQTGPTQEYTVTITRAAAPVVTPPTPKPSPKPAPKPAKHVVAKLRLGVVKSHTYALSLAKQLTQLYGGQNVKVIKEGNYYRVSATFSSKARALAVAKDMKRKGKIEHYLIYLQ